MVAYMLRTAQQDVESALRLASPPNRYALYLCEKAARSLIQAVLFSEEKPANPSLNLEQMVELVSDDNPIKPRFRKIQGLASFVATYANTTPSGQIPPPPDKHTFLSYANKVKILVKEAASRLGVDLFPNPIPSDQHSKLAS